MRTWPVSASHASHALHALASAPCTGSASLHIHVLVTVKNDKAHRACIMRSSGCPIPTPELNAERHDVQDCAFALLGSP